MLAGERIIRGDDTLARIASSLGYESEHAFGTAFKRVMGVSPRRYARAGFEEYGGSLQATETGESAERVVVGQAIAS